MMIQVCCMITGILVAWGIHLAIIEHDRRKRYEELMQKIIEITGEKK